MNKSVAMFQERLATLCIGYIKSDKRRRTNCNEFLDNFVMTKARQNVFNCLLCYVQLTSMIVAFYFFIRISITTA